MKNPGQNELDSLTVNIELTLISIIQGVALYFLTESSRELIVKLEYAYWPYILSGLFTIFNFWARAILHTLTVIRWPLDFAHTFFYFGVVFLESVAFSQIGQPAAWFFLLAALGAVILVMFVIDLRMIQNLKSRSTPSYDRLLETVEKEQKLNITWLSPGYLLFNLAFGYLILRYPRFFLQDGWQLLLGLVQMAGSLGYLVFSIGFFHRLSPLIRAHREEQLPSS